MWLNEIYLKDGTHKVFPSDDPVPPKEYFDYYNEHIDEIDDIYCVHFPGDTVESFYKRTIQSDYRS